MTIDASLTSIALKINPFLRLLFAFSALVATEGALLTARAADTGAPQYYELRVYTTKSESQQQRINDYWQKAAVPAYNRLGISPIGVFTDLQDATNGRVYILIPFETPGAYSEIPAKLASDSAYQTAAGEYLDAPKTNAAYLRFESSLLVAFEGMKKLAVPASAAEKKPWIFELRTYQSHSESKGLNKIKMFNSGEIPLMHEVGLSPIFFGQTLVGSQMPNLVYMVSGEDQDVHKQHWKAFFDAPVWKRLIGDAQYKDNVSKVISVFLKRMPASQI